jgi:phenylpyruvate tautomerase PptA (4-oxalocrotonate tautomerase family)|tara:strand:+ start:368 stop:805 length:438 start_codon:yes stop_codon:yes gene_type:complete
MPTYVVKFSNLKLSKSQKDDLAKGITDVHSKVTGANTFFAQVYFEKCENGDHYMGGKINNGSEIFLYGRIRSGRSNETKNELLTKLRDIIKKKLNLNTDNIWVYLIDLPPNQMIEYGQILPNSGEEKEWFKNLPDELRKRLQSME